MRRTRQIAQLEERHGKPIDEIVAEAYVAHGNVTDAAAALGISRSTYSYWKTRLTRMHYETEPRIVIRRVA